MIKSDDIFKELVKLPKDSVERVQLFNEYQRAYAVEHGEVFINDITVPKKEVKH